MQVNAWEGGLARSFLYGPETEDVTPALEAVPHASVSEISLADARAMALEGLELRDMAWPPDETDDEYLDDENIRALIDQRVGLLPSGGASPFGEPPDPDDIDDLFEVFLDKYFATAPEMVRNGAGWVVNNACRFADACCDMDPCAGAPGGSPFTWSPGYRRRSCATTSRSMRWSRCSRSGCASRPNAGASTRISGR